MDAAARSSDERAADLWFGTSSWSAKGWVGPFYPSGTKPGDFLTHYARRYRTVEADVTYYRVPDRRLVAGWSAKLPEGFRMAAKFPRTIAHGGEAAQPDGARVMTGARARADTDAFLAGMAHLGAKRGPLLLQFPYFNRTAFSGVVPFLERLDAYLETLPRDIAVAVEVRNGNWIAPPLLDLLRARNAALALVDLDYLPHPDELARRLGGLDLLLTANFGYVRLIGDRKATEALTTTFDRTVIDRAPQLERWAVLIETLATRLADIYVFANNHFAGHGPATIDALAARLAHARGADDPDTSAAS